MIVKIEYSFSLDPAGIRSVMCPGIEHLDAIVSAVHGLIYCDDLWGHINTRKSFTFRKHSMHFEQAFIKSHLKKLHSDLDPAVISTRTHTYTHHSKRLVERGW